MSGLFGGGSGALGNETARISALRIQTSCYGQAVPVVLGRQRCTGNLLYYGGLTAKKHKQQVGKGGGAVTTVWYTYFYDVQWGICEGPVTVGAIWMQNGDIKMRLDESTDYAYSVYPGSLPNSYNALLEAKNAGGVGTGVGSALSATDTGGSFRYAGLANLTAIQMGEFKSDSPPGLSFEVFGIGYDAAIDGADPAVAVQKIITDGRWGASGPLARFPLASAYGDYAVAMGWSIGLELAEQKPAAEWVQNILDQTNAAAVWAADHLDVVPYGDAAVSGNGRSWTPNVTPIYDLTDDDFLGDQAEPVRVSRASDSEVWNIQPVEFRNRANEYNIEVVDGSDPASVSMYGPKKNSTTLQAHGLTSADGAARLAKVRVQRKTRARNEYEFALPWNYCRLLPMDVVTLTDAALGMDRHPVRLTRVVDAGNLEVQCTAEDFPAGAGHAALIVTQASSSWSKNYNVAPGSALAPAIFEAPVFQTTTGLAVGLSVTSDSDIWGGCEVYVSYDGESYKNIGRITGRCRYGVTTGAVDAAAGASVGVSLLGADVALLPGSAADAERLATLCLIGDEMVAYTAATLTGENAYSLTLARRGAYKSAPVSHASGSRFVRIDDTVLWSDSLDLSMIGATIYFKFCSFNLYGGGAQALDAVAPHAYTITGAMAKLPPSDVTEFGVVYDQLGLRLKWIDIADGDRKDYIIRKGATWETSVEVAAVASTELQIAPLGAGSHTFWIVARDKFGNLGTTPASVTVAAAAPVAPTVSVEVSDTDYVLHIGQPASMFVIDYYEIRSGNEWSSGTVVGRTYGTIFQAPVLWGGERTFLVAAVDVAGNIGPAGAASLSIAPPSMPTVTAQVIDNNVLLYWTDSTTALPIWEYEMRRGADYATAERIGTKQGLFTTLFETVAGTFTYWVAGIDSAGNVGAPRAFVATVSQPPDYALKANIDSTLAGTLSNAYQDDQLGGIVMPVSTTETFSSHFSSRGWASPQAQIDAGYPVFAQPSASPGYYEEVFDYGAVLPSSKITVTPTWSAIAGSPSVTIDIGTSADGVSYTAFPGASQVFATAFRYVKVRITATGDSHSLINLTGLNVRLDQKLKTITGTATCAAGDAGGTVVYVTDDGTAGGDPVFIDIDSIQVTAQGTSPVTAIYDFVDAPYPTYFKILLFNAAGARVSGTASWTTRGY